MRNVKGTSSNGREKIITRNKKIIKENNLNNKGKHIGNIVDQPLNKVTVKLKRQSSKII